MLQIKTPDDLIAGCNADRKYKLLPIQSVWTDFKKKSNVPVEFHENPDSVLICQKKSVDFQVPWFLSCVAGESLQKDKADAPQQLCALVQDRIGLLELH